MAAPAASIEAGSSEQAVSQSISVRQKSRINIKRPRNRKPPILPVIRRIVGHPHLMTTMPTATAIRLARTRGKLVKPNQSKWT